MAQDGLQKRDGHQFVDLFYGFDNQVAEWVRIELGMDVGFKDFSAIGITDGERIIAGVVYSNYRHPNIEMSIASISPRWATRRILKALFSYPFEQLGCNRVTGIVDKDAVSTRRFDERLGFVHEGTMREGNPAGDAEIYGMLKRECKWL